MRMGKNMEYVALLRGINVGGHTVKMDILRQLFVEMKFVHVRSYIQTGNIFFETARSDIQELESEISQQLEEKLGFSIAVCLRTIKQLEDICQRNPFAHKEVSPDTRFAVTFFAQPIVTPFTLPYWTLDHGYEVIDQTTSEIFVIWHLQNGRPANSYTQIEKQLHIPSTTRFWHTLQKILAAAKQNS